MKRLALLVVLVAADALAQPGTLGVPGHGSGSAAGSGSTGSGSAGSGSAGSGSNGPKIIQLPTDVGAPEVSAAASPAVVRLGARFTLFVTATFGEGIEVNLPEPIELGSGFEVRRKLSEDKPHGDGRTTREWQIEVVAWELGDVQVAPVRVTFSAFGHAGQVQTNAVPLKVVGVLGDVVDDPKAMRGLASPTGLTSRDWFWIWFATALGAVTGVVLGSLWYRSRRKHRTIRLVGNMIAAPIKRVDMTAARALERLLEIERSGVLDGDDTRKTGYAEMVDVVREYLAARYRIATLDLTSLEVVGRLAKVAPEDETALVEAWLDGCDLVKYSGLQGSPADAGKALDDARAMIVMTTKARETKPPTPPPPPPETEEAA